MGNDLIVDEREGTKTALINSPDAMLVSWIMSRLNSWRDYRDQNYKDRWSAYYRLWRGIHTPSDKTRNSERSKLVHPATSQAVDTTVSEIEEAIFGRGNWFLTKPGAANPEEDLQELEKAHALLKDDIRDRKIVTKLSEAILIGALYGTGVVKVVVNYEKVPHLSMKLVGKEAVVENNEDEKPVVDLVPIPLDKFIIDPFATDIEGGLGCAHEDIIPKHTIKQKIRDGIYWDAPLSQSMSKIDYNEKGESKPQDESAGVSVIEYHGLVPELLLLAVMDRREEFSMTSTELDDMPLVEAVVTISDEKACLKATDNKFVTKDRSFVAFPLDLVPNRFYGRGIAEKGYNVQKALEAEMRGRIDALAMIIHPMMGVDITRLGGKSKGQEIRPGRNIMTIGDPSTVLRPFKFGEVSQSTFAQSGELERLFNGAVGSVGQVSPDNVGSVGSTMGGMSMVYGTPMKRSRRMLQNIESSLLIPVLKKILWRYMQFDNDRYPVINPDFQVVSTLGIMAREVEQANISNMLKTVKPASPAYWMLMRSMYQLSSLDNRDELIALATMMLKKTMNPDPQQAQIQMAEVQKTLENLDSKTQLNKAKSLEAISKSNPQPLIDKELIKSRTVLAKEALNDQTRLQTKVLDAHVDLRRTAIQHGHERNMNMERVFSDIFKGNK